MTTSEQTTFSATLSGSTRTVSWGAIFAGVFVAAASYLALLILGTGLGFTIVSPWNFQDYASGTIGMAALLWIILTQIISSAGGGYIAGRMAPHECDDHSQHVRGTNFYHAAHGLVVWALSSIAIAFLLATAASNILSGGASMVKAAGKGMGAGIGAGIGAGTGIGIGAGTIYLRRAFSVSDEGNGQEEGEAYSYRAGDNGDIIGYALDSLLRPGSTSDVDPDGRSSSSTTTNKHGNNNVQSSNTQKKVIERIFITSVQKNEISDADKKYVAQLISERAGISQEEALRRIDETLEKVHADINKLNNQAKEALNSAREAAATAALWSFVTLLLGALVTAAAACYGGNLAQRCIARSQKERTGR